jgi:hypothetical protein
LARLRAGMMTLTPEAISLFIAQMEKKVSFYG